MKKILFCLQTLVRGGVEKELIVISKLLINKGHDVTVCILYSTNIEIEYELHVIGVNILNLNIDREYYCSGNKNMICSRIHRGFFIEASICVIKHLLKIGCYESNISIDDIPNIDQKYDIVVCFHIHSPLMVKFVIEKTKADNKIAWIHNDFSTTGYKVNKMKRYLSKYSQIIAVSEQVKDEFCERCRNLADRTKVVYNILDKEEIVNKSFCAILDSRFSTNQDITILTIGRLTEQKGIDIAIDACALLVSRKLNIKWYVIGSGECFNILEEKIDNMNLRKNFVLLGEKDNPYPYLRACDIYVQPSRHEGYGLAVAEARLLNKPIVSTDFAGALEQLVPNKTGLVVKANDVNALVTSIEKMAKEDVRKTFSYNLSCENNQKSNSDAILGLFE